MEPNTVLLFSGKRKSGKDFITDHLQERLKTESVIIRLSGPLKECYAKDHGLDYQKMLSASDYKEKYRLDMIAWSEQIRNGDYTYFCEAALKKYEAGNFPIWIVSDCRRKSDLRYFREKFGDRVKTVRIVTDDKVRQERGWRFTCSVDDAESECGLDDVDDWDLVLDNSGSKDTQQLLEQIINIVDAK